MLKRLKYLLALSLIFAANGYGLTVEEMVALRDSLRVELQKIASANTAARVINEVNKNLTVKNSGISFLSSANDLGTGADSAWVVIAFPYSSASDEVKLQYMEARLKLKEGGVELVDTAVAWRFLTPYQEAIEAIPIIEAVIE